MAALQVCLTFQKSGAFKNTHDVNLCKQIVGFPHPELYGWDYKAWRNAMKSKMEQDRILGWKRSTAAQWVAI